jgi:CelD/BcsL family acetyltransferase involved in cellulose biosynthesis
MTETSDSKIHTGNAALALSADTGFRAEWAGLLAGVSWATPFQSAGFAAAWFASYARVHEPLLVVVRDQGQALIGVFAGGRGPDGVVAAGGFQAEYPGWLARDADVARVFDAVLDALEARFGRQSLLLRYLPPGFPLAALLGESRHRGRLLARPFKRPIMVTADPSIEESLRKKGNKSKLSRLKRRGPVEFEVCNGEAEFAAAFDAIIAQYDARQKASHGVAPFEHDVNKRAFHVELMRAGLLHVSILRVGGQVGAAHVGAKGASEIHLSIVSFDPAMADDSPNKLLLLMLGQRLKADGFRTLDLTPGGDPWKDRFATAFDEVQELTVFTSALSCTLARCRGALRGLLKKLVKRPAADSAAPAGD